MPVPANELHHCLPGTWQYFCFNVLNGLSNRFIARIAEVVMTGHLKGRDYF